MQPIRASDDPGRRQAARSRVVDIARAAGVSTATVDRVLNRRPGVRAITVQQVLKVAVRIGYLPEDDLHAAVQPPPLKLSFLLPAGTNRFLRMLGDTIGYSQDHLSPFNVKCRCEFIEGFNPEVLARSLLQHGRRADGIAFMALEHPAVREAVNTLAARGVATITLISDLSACNRGGLRGAGQPCRRPHGRLPAGALHRPACRQGRDDRRLAELSRA